MKDETVQRGSGGRPGGNLPAGGPLRPRLLLFTGYAVGACLVLVAVFFTVRAGCRAVERVFLTENPHFTLQKLDVVVNGNLRREEVIRRLAGWNVKPGQSNLFALDIPVLRERLMKYVMVSKADFSIQLPDTLVVNVTERVPVAQLKSAGGRLIDADGWMLPPLPQATLKPDALPLVFNLKSAEQTPTGQRITDPMGLAVLRVLHLVGTRTYGQILDVRGVQCDPEAKTLRLHLRARNTFIDGASIILPASSEVEIDAALLRVERIAMERMRAQQKTKFIDATYIVNVPVLGAVDSTSPAASGTRPASGTSSAASPSAVVVPPPAVAEPASPVSPATSSARGTRPSSGTGSRPGGTTRPSRPAIIPISGGTHH